MRGVKGVILVTPNLRPYHTIASKEIIKLFNAFSFEYVLVPLPEEVESLLLSYLIGEKTYEELVNSIMSTYPWCSVLSRQYINMRPVLEVLKRMSSTVKFKVRCYSDVSSTHAELMSLAELISLIIRARTTGRFNFDKLIGILSKYLNASNKALRKLTGKVKEVLFSFKGCWLMISDFKGRYLASSLREYGIEDVKLLYITPYVFTPLERLVRKYLYSSLSADVAIDLVRAHVDFLWNYVLLSEDINDAYLTWLKEKYYQDYLTLMSKLYG
mgnify:CR=1 FL=1